MVNQIPEDNIEKMLEHKALDIIAQVSTKLLEADVNTFDYRLLTDTMNEISGSAYSALNVFDENKHYFTTIAISGDYEMLKKVEGYVGSNLINKQWHNDPRREKYLSNKMLTRFDSLKQLTTGVIQESIIEAIEDQFYLGPVYILKIVRNTVTIGDFTLFFSKNNEINSQKMCEFFAKQSGLVIEKLRAEEGLLNNELKQKQMISGISDVIAILSPEGSIKYISPNVSRIFGWMPEELTGKTYHNNIHPDDLEIVTLAFSETMTETGDPQPTEFRLKCKDGNYKHIELNGTNLERDPIIEGILINFHDISKRKKFEAEATKLNQAVKHSSAAIIITDPNANIEYVNPKFCERTGYAFEEVKGKNPRFLKSGLTPSSLYSEMWKTIVTGKEWKGEVLNKTKDGTLFWEMASISSIKDKYGKITNYVAVKENITHLKAQQEAIKEQNILLQKTNAEKDKFFSIIAHDLRGPFSALLGLSEIMSEQVNTMPLHEIQELALNLKQSATNIYDLLSNLLEWAMLQRGITHIDRETLVVDHFVDKCCDALNDMANNKSISIKFNYQKGQTAYADLNMLKSIMRNLVSNAIKFSHPTSTIVINIEATTENAVQFTIIDKGIGIPNEILEKLFKIDQKTGRAGTQNEPSTGLGLLLCKDLVELHGGKIWVETNCDETTGETGSKFSFTIPNH